MKKTLLDRILILAFLAFAALPLSAQSSGINTVISLFKSHTEEYNNAYDAKDYRGAVTALTRLIADVDTVSLTPDERKEYTPLINGSKNNVYYNLACSYSLLNMKKQAVEAFAKSVELGYDDYRHTLVDTDLDNIRGLKSFKQQLAILKQRDKLEILKHVAPYEAQATDSLPKFTYQKSSDWRLAAVRDYFNLDSVAGNGDEISKIINLMRFVHDKVRHDGGFRPTCEFDAIDLYNYTKVNNCGANCRCLAIILCEMYLAEGFPARFVTCLPADPDDSDCHVIDVVWSKQLGKWIWMDPTFEAYVKDDKGNFLGIQEVRQRLISGQPLVLNDDANWNHESKETQEDYLDGYMAKNLYWLQCSTVSKFNTESPFYDTKIDDISLIPKGFTTTKYLGKYSTTDDNYFWQKPEQ